MTDDLSRRRQGRKYTQKRSENMSLWVDAPLQNLIRDELARRDLTISDLARQINSQPSLISRWMQGQRPNTESLALIADALGLDVLKLLEMAGHIPLGVLPGEESAAIAPLIATLRQIERDGHLTDERCLMLFTLLEWMRTTPPAVSPRNSQGAHQDHLQRAAG